MKKIQLLSCSAWERVWTLLFSFAFFFFLFLGMHLDQEVTIPFSKVLLSILFAIIPAAVLGELLVRFNHRVTRKRTGLSVEIEKKDWKKFLLYLVVLMACWFVVFLAYYPGFLNYDVRDQIFQSPGYYNTNNPLIHTFMMKGSIIVGWMLRDSATLGVAVHALFQMTVTAAVVAYLLLFLYRVQVRKWIRIVLLVFFAVFPVWPILAMSSTKDILFGDGFLAATLCLCYWAIKPALFSRKRFLVLYIVSLFIACLFRPGSIWCAVLVMAGAVLFLWRNKRRMLIVVLGTAGALALSMGTTAILNYVTQAISSKHNEMVCVPLQQVALSYLEHQDDFSEEEKEQIYRIIPAVESYTPFMADFVKNNSEYYNYKGEFWKLYLKMLLHYPGTSLDAALQNSKGLWYLYDISSHRIYTSQTWVGGGVGYLLTDIQQEFLPMGIIRSSFIPWLLDAYQDLVNLNSFEQIPVFRMLFSLAAYFWAAMLAFSAAIVNRRKQAVLPLLFVAAYILGVFFCPCIIARYCYAFMLCVPALFVLGYTPIPNGGSDKA